MKKYTQDEIEELMLNHQEWINVHPDIDHHSSDANRVNLRGVDLRHLNFRNKNLSGAYFHFCNMRHVNFRGSDLSGAVFDHCDLLGSTFYDANLRSTAFRNSCLMRSSYDGEIITFSGGEHPLQYSSDREVITIGCEVHSPKEWARIYRRLGEKHYYRKEDIIMYGAVIKGINKIHKELKGVMK
jgi:uncharacterized protein YjbI with pentapeptide repeats